MISKTEDIFNFRTYFHLYTLFAFLFFIAPKPPRIKHSNRKITSLENLDVVEAKIGDELTLLAGANVVITCPTSGLPTPTAKWLKDGEDLSVNGSILTIKNAKTEDSGTFTCEAVNRAGRFSYNSEFRVIGKFVSKRLILISLFERL